MKKLICGMMAVLVAGLFAYECAAKDASSGAADSPEVVIQKEQAAEEGLANRDADRLTLGDKLAEMGERRATPPGDGQTVVAAEAAEHFKRSKGTSTSAHSK